MGKIWRSKCRRAEGPFYKNGFGLYQVTGRPNLVNVPRKRERNSGPWPPRGLASDSDREARRFIIQHEQQHNRETKKGSKPRSRAELQYHLTITITKTANLRKENRTNFEQGVIKRGDSRAGGEVFWKGGPYSTPSLRPAELRCRVNAFTSRLRSYK